MNLLKRTVWIAVMIIVTFASVYGQGVIITQKAEKIDAKVLEVDVHVIRYEKTNNVEGTIYSIPKNEIVAILYQNGTVDVFEQSSARAKLNDEEKMFDKHAGTPIVRHGRRYNFEGTNINMSKWDYKDFLERNCPQAYQSYKKGRKLNTLGIIFVSAGGFTTLFGSIGWINNYVDWANSRPRTYKQYYDFYRRQNSYIVFTVFGIAGLSAGVPMLIKGIQLKRKTSVDIYNNNCINKKTTNLYFGFNPNSVNLTLKF